MKMTCTLPDHAAAVEALLEGFVRACQVIIESGLAPLDPRDADVRYQLEGPGEEDWKLPQNVIRDGWGDCEDLAGWRAAGLRVSGEDPMAKVVVVKTGVGKLHAVVQRGDGAIDDPSRELHMRRKAMLGADKTPRGAQSIDHRTGSSYGKYGPGGNDGDARLRNQTYVNPDHHAPTDDEGARAVAVYQASKAAGLHPQAFVKATNTITATSPEDAAAKGFKFVDGHYERMYAEEVQAAKDGVYDPTNDSWADDSPQYEGGQYADQYYQDGGLYDYDASDWVDQRAVRAFEGGEQDESEEWYA